MKFDFADKLSLMRWLVLGFSLAHVVCAQNVISVQNAASPASINGAVAPGSIISIQVIRGGPVVINPDPSKITVKLRRTADGKEYDAKVLQAFLGTTLALVPEDIPLGPVDVLYVQDGQASLPARLDIASSAFGLFTQSRNGIGPALAQNGPEFALNKMFNPALRGDVVTVWGTGLGDASSNDVSVEAAGLSAPVMYAGKAPGYPGLDQINFQVPSLL